MRWCESISCREKEVTGKSLCADIISEKKKCFGCHCLSEGKYYCCIYIFILIETYWSGICRFSNEGKLVLERNRSIWVGMKALWPHSLFYGLNYFCVRTLFCFQYFGRNYATYKIMLISVIRSVLFKVGRTWNIYQKWIKFGSIVEFSGNSLSTWY